MAVVDRRERARLAHPFQWRLPAIDTYPRVVAFAQTHAGKLVMFLVFAGLMKLVAPGMWIEERGMWLAMTIAAALVSLAGPYRHVALLITTAALLTFGPNWIDFRSVQATMQQEYRLDAGLARG